MINPHTVVAQAREVYNSRKQKDGHPLAARKAIEVLNQELQQCKYDCEARKILVKATRTYTPMTKGKINGQQFRTPEKMAQ